jgi:3-phosphoshikimate 1-carboxyvinyltransferase
MGASILARDGGRLPLVVTGAEPLMPIEFELPVPSAQVKSAILLAGLGAPGETTVIEPMPSRDHTERLLRRFGAEVRTEPAGGGNRITVVGEPELVPAAVEVPGDPSSAAFAVVAALLTPDSEVRIDGVGVNPHRTGLFETLRGMGADIGVGNERDASGEPVADLTARSGPLTGVTVPAGRAPSMIDEIPILAVAAAAASGETRMEGLAELRVKESDRLAAIAAGLDACGVPAHLDGDALVVEGRGGPPPGGGRVAAPHDHRIAMAFLVLGLGAKAPVTVEGAEAIDTSFPGFADLFAGLGADLGADLSAP